MIERRKIITTSEVVDDIKCDICGNSCCVDSRENELDRELKMISVIDDSKIEKQSKQFEYLKLTADWGYFSNNKDMEYWEAYVCEKCVDEHLIKLIKFNKVETTFGTVLSRHKL